MSPANAGDKERAVMDYFFIGAPAKVIENFAELAGLNRKQRLTLLSIYCPTQKVQSAADEAGMERRSFSRWRKNVPTKSLPELKRLVLNMLLCP